MLGSQSGSLWIGILEEESYQVLALALDREALVKAEYVSVKGTREDLLRELLEVLRIWRLGGQRRKVLAERRKLIVVNVHMRGVLATHAIVYAKNREEFL